MSVSLRVVLDQLVSPTSGDLESASRELALALIDTAPLGCRVEAIAPAGEALAVPGLAGEKRMRFARRELAASWQLGVTPGVGGGMIHSPTLMAPLVRHDRVNDGDQTVVTIWDLTAWEHADELPKPEVAWHRAMLRRAAKHADAIVVPTHAIAERLAGHIDLDERVRVIAGGVSTGFAVPSDADARRRDLGLGLPVGGHGVVVFLLAHGVDLDDLPVALREELRGHIVGLGLHEGSLGAVARPSG